MPPVMFGQGIALPQRHNQGGGSSTPAFSSPADLSPTVWYEGLGYTDAGGTTPPTTPGTDRIALQTNRGSAGGAAASQATPGYRPLVSKISPLVESFDGSTNLLSIASNTLSTTGACTLWARYKASIATGNRGIFSLRGASTYEYILPVVQGLGPNYPDGITWVVGAPAGGSSGVYCAAGIDTNWHTLIIAYNGGDPTLPSSYVAYLDGVAQVVLTSGPLGVNNASAIGVTPGFANYFAGLVASLGRAPGAISAATAAQLTTYLNALS